MYCNPSKRNCTNSTSRCGFYGVWRTLSSTRHRPITWITCFHTRAAFAASKVRSCSGPRSFRKSLPRKRASSGGNREPQRVRHLRSDCRARCICRIIPCMPDQSSLSVPSARPSNQLDVLGVTCPMGHLQTPQDRYHVLYFHVGQSVEMTCRLDGSERSGGVHHPGHLCVLPAGVTGQWTMDAPANSLVLRLTPTHEIETADALRLKPAHARIAPALRIRDPHLEYIGWRLSTERAAGYPYGRVFLDSLAAAIAGRLLQRGGHHPTGAPHASIRQLPKWRLRMVCDYIRANLDRDLSLEELANIAGFSVSHFKPLFRHAVGLPVHRYVVECRVERARQLLLQGDRAMSEIALVAGFCHQTHMARCLRRVLGISSAQIASLGRYSRLTVPMQRLL